MTCGSLVRWPRDLHVFRCVICMTINDLQPLATDNEAEHTTTLEPAGPDDSTTLQAKSKARSADTVSFETTRSLVTQCLRDFIETALNDYAMARQRRPEPTPVSEQRRSTTFYKHASRRGSQTHISPESSRNTSSISIASARGSSGRAFSTSYPERRPVLHDMTPEKAAMNGDHDNSGPEIESKPIFKRLDDYIASTFTSFQCLNTSFIPDRGALRVQPHPEPIRRRPPEQEQSKDSTPKESPSADNSIPDLDPKLLLLGDFAENGSWWTGGQEGYKRPVRAGSKKACEGHGPSLVSHRSPRIDWDQLDEWYNTVVNCAGPWRGIYDDVVTSHRALVAEPYELQELETRLLRAQEHTRKSLMKATESVLKRPGRPLNRPSDLRFLLILLSNPLLHASHKTSSAQQSATNTGQSKDQGPKASGPASGQHSGVIKRFLGILSNTPPECHNYLIAWFAKYPESRFANLKDLVGGFLAYRLCRQHDKKHRVKVDVVEGLIPNMPEGQSAASLHASLRPSTRSNRKKTEPANKQVYHDDWQIRAAAQVMALVFAANNVNCSRKNTLSGGNSAQNESNGTVSRHNVRARGQLLPTSDFYMALLDDMDLIADFEAWSQKKAKFAFCQYPFLLSIWAKIQILEYDTRRQMEVKARDAFFDNILSRGAMVSQHLVLEVRRECLVEDSLKAVSEVIGSGSEDIKKGLKVVFKGEEGVDFGGIRKEWFLLLVREVFNPDHGMFVYDEDSQYCYFNPNSFETSDQYFLIGVVFGLAIYNSTILDVAFPPFAFRKLLLAAPPAAATSPSLPRPVMQYTLDDLAQYRPRLAHGFRQLLDYDGDVETFELDFVVDIEKYGIVEHVPLCPGGEKRPVTNSNRREYVDLYVRYLLDTAVTRQFEPFKRGFFTVCGGNALSLFRAEEIELLVRGSDEALDITGLRTAAVYENWPSRDPEREEDTIKWFWNTFEQAAPRDQRKLLLFITGSDRIPAMGAASLSIRIACLGDDHSRYPSARTCFNLLALYKYRSRNMLERMLWTAVQESEGFGLK